MSPTLFKLFLKNALKSWNDSCRGMGINSNDHMLHTLLFADDQVIVGQDREDVEYMFRKLVNKYNLHGLKVNFMKTEYLVVAGKEEDFVVNDITIKNVSQLKYWGSIVDSFGTCEKDKDNGISQARSLNGILWNREMTKTT